jgi:molybdopterin converting factor small subunit
MDTVKLLYFAQAARWAGRESETLRLDAAVELGTIQEEVLRRHPGLRRLEGSLLWAVDEEMAGAATAVSPGQTVAVMPPFSGG